MYENIYYVFMFKRRDVKINRNYHIVLGSDNNLD